MKKALLVICAIALVTWVVSWFWAEDGVATSAARPWPGGMGTLESVFDRFPPRQENDASRKLTALANALPKNEAADDFVRREIALGELTIGEPPALSDISAIRELLLREPIVWERHVAFDHHDAGTRRALQMTMARALVASALTKAELFNATRCDVNARANEPGTDLTSVWRRAFRYRAEREAAANALRVREGRPIETKSACSNGTWSFHETTLRFSREIPSSTSEKECRWCCASNRGLEGHNDRRCDHHCRSRAQMRLVPSNRPALQRLVAVAPLGHCSLVGRRQ